MDLFSTYTLIIGATVLILLSFLFSDIAKHTNVPAVLLLLGLGIGLQFLLKYLGREDIDFSPFLKVLGSIGLFVIVLEAALNLKFSRGKGVIIFKSFLVALLGMSATGWVVASILHYMIPDINFKQALIYAAPLCIMSSAIIIPGVRNLRESKKDFHHYESTFSDILGIMLFFFLIWMFDPGVDHTLSVELLGEDFINRAAKSVVIALGTSYVVLFFFQRIHEKAELVVLVSVLLLLYAVSMQLHLSPLIVILVFGIVMSNLRIFFKGPLKRLLTPETFREMHDGLHDLTSEITFIVRIFFFVVFGASIVLASLLNLKFLLVSGLILLSIYLIRALILRLFIGKNINPQLWITPRGLITVLLFYAIPVSYQTTAFNPGILMVVIIFSGLVMTAGKISHRMKKEDVERQQEAGPAAEAALKPSEFAPTLRPGASRLEERWVTRVQILKHKIKMRIVKHPIYIVQKKRLKRFVEVTFRTLGVQLIFNPETKRFNRRLRNVIAMLSNPAQRVNLKQNQDYKNLKRYVHRVIFNTDTLEGLLFDIGLFILIILSVLIVMLGSVSGMESVWGRAIRGLDWVITIIFTIEYALRIWTVAQPRKYIFSFFGMVDLLSILPLYAEVIFAGLYSLEIIRVVRLVRIFRVLKLIRFVSEAETIGLSLRASANKIFVFLFFVLIVCTIIGSVMFLVEGPESGFTNIPKSIYWAVVTLTTVGYGDITPATGLGQFIAMFLMIMGYGVIAVPTGLVAAGVMSGVKSKGKNKKAAEKTNNCPVCEQPVQSPDASYCSACGVKFIRKDTKEEDGPLPEP